MILIIEHESGRCTRLAVNMVRHRRKEEAREINLNSKRPAVMLMRHHHPVIRGPAFLTVSPARSPSPWCLDLYSVLVLILRLDNPRLYSG